MKRLPALALTLLLLAPPLRPAAAADAPEPSRIAYDVYWSGFNIADVLFVLGTGPRDYRAEMTIVPKGVLRWMSNFSAELVSEGAFLPGGITKPTRFTRAWKSTKREGVVTITHDPATGVATTLHKEIKDGIASEKGDDEKVGPDMRTDVVDPLAVLVAMRHSLHSGARRDLTYRLYDGKRRFDLSGDVGDARLYRIMERDHAVVPMTLAFTPLAGFSPRQEKGWKEAEFRVFFSDDARTVPVQIMLDTMLGGLVLNLKEGCVVETGDCRLERDAFGFIQSKG